MHDTVLGHLAAIAAAPPGPLGPAMRQKVERDLEVLIGEEWLSDDARDVDTRARTEWQHSPLFVAIEESRTLGLDVEVTGDPAAVARLDPARAAALGLAAKQCLVNVLRHSGVDRADVVVFGADTDVSVMIIDNGKGFVVDETGADRLGIRASVRRRHRGCRRRREALVGPGQGHLGRAPGAGGSRSRSRRMTHREQTVQQLDPLGGCERARVTVFGSIAIVGYAIVMTIFNRARHRHPGARRSRRSRCSAIDAIARWRGIQPAASARRAAPCTSSRSRSRCSRWC